MFTSEVNTPEGDVSLAETLACTPEGASTNGPYRYCSPPASMSTTFPTAGCCSTTFPPRVPALIAMDLSHVNQALALKGQVDAIVGADVFEAQAAIIDYARCSLFLKSEEVA